MTGTFGSVLAAFEPPSTKDFVWDCWGPALRVGGLELCMNFIFFLVLLGFVAMLGFFYFALRKPRVVPGKLQSTAEIGIQFVRENIALDAGFHTTVLPMSAGAVGRFAAIDVKLNGVTA